MSANPTNAGLDLADEMIASHGPMPLVNATPPPGAATHEAFQSLLAFSALQQQVREKHAREESNSAPSDEFQAMQQFVLDEVLQIVAERALTIIGCDGIAIALAEGEQIVCRASAGSIAPD